VRTFGAKATVVAEGHDTSPRHTRRHIRVALS
jgi:hypothetical protein